MAALTVIAAGYQKDSVASGHLIANDIGMFITTMGNYHFLVTAEITLKPLARYSRFVHQLCLGLLQPVQHNSAALLLGCAIVLPDNTL